MGNCCGKQSSGNFTGQGRTLGAAQPTAAPSTQPGNTPLPPKISSAAGKALGGSSSGDASSSDDPRSAAARAAEARAAQSDAPKGKLGQKLQEERKQTRTDMLEQASADERRRRDAADNAEARNWN